MSKKKKWNEDVVYINEIIRINYKCNWKCKFCNVLKTNNYWEHDVSDKEVVYKILALTKKYNKDELNNLILSFSWWEPTLNKKICSFIELAKKIWVWMVQIQTNWTLLFKDKNFINDLKKSWLDEIFLAQHWFDDKINKKLGTFYNIDDFKDWVTYVKENNIHKDIWIAFNIVINKININWIYDYILFLKEVWFLDLLPNENNNWFKDTKRISFGLVQPNGYAEINKEEVLLEFNDNELKKLHSIIALCKDNNIYSDFHFTAPPLCILDYKEYNLEYQRMVKIEEDKKNWELIEWNLDSYKYLWKEKQKFSECSKCKNNDYCLWFYKNWIEFVWENYVKDKILSYIK
jgi:MoaA/NifB/PqqE/SkfB family radical SAM enzyme